MTTYRKPVATRCDGCGEMKPTVQEVALCGLRDAPAAFMVTLGKFCRRCRGELQDAVEDVTKTIRARA